MLYYLTAVPTAVDPDFTKILDSVVLSDSITMIIITVNWSFRYLPMNEFKPVLDCLVDENPTFPFDPQRCKFQVAPLGPQDCSQLAEQYFARPSFDLSTLIQTTKSVDGATFISVADYFCQQNTCDMTRGNSILYRDQGDLNLIRSPVLRLIGSSRITSRSRASSGKRAPAHPSWEDTYCTPGKLSYFW